MGILIGSLIAFMVSAVASHPTRKVAQTGLGRGCSAPYSAAPPHKTGFWIAPGEAYLDRQTLGFVACRASIVVLNLPQISPAGDRYSPSALIRGIHAQSPGTPVLVYAWGTRWYPGRGVDAVALAGFADLGKLLIRDGRGLPVTLPRRGLLADVRATSYHVWLADRLKSMIKQAGADGVALDNMTAAPPAIALTAVENRQEFLRDYAAGVARLLRTVAEAVRPKTLLVNGLWNSSPGMLPQQESLLSETDGAAVEFFASAYNRSPSFKFDVLPYLQVMSRHSGKLFVVFGRGSRESAKYQSYASDYLWQRYAYASYLLGAGPLTAFKYLSTFGMNSQSARSDGISVFADADIDIGDALAPFIEEGGIYTRKFTNGLVLVAPPEGSEIRYTLPSPMYSPEGDRIAKDLVLRPGTGTLLLRNKPAQTLSLRAVFDSAKISTLGWIGASLGLHEQAPYMHLTAMPSNRKWEHDLLLDPVRRLHPFDSLRIRYRTSDPNAALDIAVEVDDQSATHYFCEIRDEGHVGDRYAHRPAPGLAFRSGSTPLQPTLGTSPLVADGSWHDLALGGFARNHGNTSCEFRRFAFVRFTGALDVSSVELRYASGSRP